MRDVLDRLNLRPPAGRSSRSGWSVIAVLSMIALVALILFVHVISRAT
jgi:hypothetical protein